ncbi:MAG: hypothetical protein CBB71_11485 [Rhodopirellula sp. TMED11]|nr:MAG: hypothetical protein CBB71_11485 [Rhodopirellula sp. TMED11]
MVRRGTGAIINGIDDRCGISAATVASAAAVEGFSGSGVASDRRTRSDVVLTERVGLTELSGSGE